MTTFYQKLSFIVKEVFLFFGVWKGTSRMLQILLYRNLRRKNGIRKHGQSG